MKFLDQAIIYAKSGSGGPGCLNFRREKYVARGGPDGGDGGHGGDVIAECVTGLNTLVDYRYQQHFKARDGSRGGRRNRTGADGADVVLRVPAGTQIFEEDSGSLLVDLTEPGQRVVLLEGGRGGFGNNHYKSPTNRAPRRVDPGQPGDERRLRLRLKLVADAGLIGLPNAGKSTLLARVSRARPKIADYPFTTLVPQLGVVHVGGEEIVLADIPGLIAGAHEGKGLGDRFLGHLERCGVLLHLVDGVLDDVAADWRTIRHELAQYGHGLEERPEVIALNKCDALTPEAIAAKRAALEDAAGAPVLTVSGVSGLGVEEAMAALVARLRRDRATLEAGRGTTGCGARNKAWAP